MAPEERSILQRLDEAGRSAPRVRLRTDEDGNATPVLRRSGRFEVLGDLATGGVGEVMKGRDVDLGRDVAIKVLRERFLDEPDVLRRFVEEAQIGGQLQHPGIVPVYELGLQEGDERPFFAMKLVKGRTLAALLRDRREPSADRRRLLQVFEQVCQTVAYAHRRGVVHRDLKPANIMVGAFGEVQVLDWGFAKVMPRGGVADERAAPPEIDVTRITTLRSEDVEGSRSLAGSVMGTPAYMPPEQALGRVDELDERSDVFSLGAVLCEVLTGRPPYVGEDLLVQAAQAAQDDALARLDACGADVVLVDLAKRCLSPLRKDRPLDASDPAGTVRDYLASVEERAHRASVQAAATRAKAARARMEAEQQRRLRRLGIAVAASVLVAVLIGSGSWWWIASEQQERTRRTTDVVTAAMREAEAKRGQAQDEGTLSLWEDARLAALRAEELAGAEDVEETARRRAAVLAEAVAKEVEEVRADHERREREATFLAELEEIRLARGASLDPAGFEDRLREAFTRRGVDLDHQPPSETATILAADTGGILVEVANMLDEWALLRHVKEALQDRDPGALVAVANLIDPDPWRKRLRVAMVKDDVRPLLDLVEESDDPDLPARTADIIGIALLEAGDREAAGTWLRRAARKHPGDFWILFHAGTFCPTEDVRTRIENLTATVALRGDHAYARICLAGALLDRGRREDLDRVLEHSGRAIELRPELGLAHSSYGEALVRQGRAAEGIAYHLRAIELDPEFAKLHTRLAIAHGSLGDRKAAIASHRRALALEPGQAPFHYNLGVALHRSGELDEAVACYREAVRLDPTDVRAWTRLSLALARLGKTEEVLDSRRKLAELSPDDPRVHRELGAALLEAGRLVEALASFREALRLHPGDFRSLYNGACALARLVADVPETLPAAERDRLRSEALAFLRLALRLHGARDPEALKLPLSHWREDPDLASVREEEALGTLPEGERADWRSLWAQVDRLLADETEGK